MALSSNHRHGVPLVAVQARSCRRGVVLAQPNDPPQTGREYQRGVLGVGHDDRRAEHFEPLESAATGCPISVKAN